jgi:hypothetical protein
MDPADFDDLLQLKPFLPFRIHLSNGGAYDIRHPEIAVVKVSVVWLYFPAKEMPIPIAEQKIVVVL